jgi:membrane-associated phospholipid phosphatase
MIGARRTVRRLATSLLLALPSAPMLPGPVLAQNADSTSSSRPLFTYRDAILAGAFAVTARLVHPLDEHYRHRLQDSSTQANRKLQTLATFVRTTATPGSYIIGGTMYTVGRIAKNQKLASLGLHGTEALIIGEGVAGVVKALVGRQRPSVTPANPNSYQFMRGLTGGDEYRSFPSGHTVSAFAAAAAVTAETAHNAPNTTWIVAPILFGGATLVGVSRMYNNRHWASDVIVGAGIGTFAGLKVVRFNDSHAGNRVDRFFLTGSLVPEPGGGHALHLSLLPASLLPASLLGLR